MCFRPVIPKRAENICPACKKVNTTDAEVCAYCGAKLPRLAPPPGQPGGAPPKPPADPIKTLMAKVAAILGIDQQKFENAVAQAQKEMQDEALTAPGQPGGAPPKPPPPGQPGGAPPRPPTPPPPKGPPAPPKPPGEK